MIGQLPFSKDGILLNIPAFSAREAEELLEVSNGKVLFAVTAHDNGLEGGIRLVNELKQVASIVSVALGGGGNINAWNTALQIAKETGAGHLNQPLLTAPYAQGLLPEQIVNGLLNIKPDGTLSLSWLDGKQAIILTSCQAGRMATDMQLRSLKLLNVGAVPLNVYKQVVKNIAECGIGIVELAGGLNSANVCSYVSLTIDAGCKAIPHVFGAVADFNRSTVDIYEVMHYAKTLRL
jgi:hypothetical protein